MSSQILQVLKRHPRLTAVLVTVLLAPIAVFAISLAERGVWHEYNWTVGPREVYARVVRNCGLLGTSVRICRGANEVRLRQANGLGTMASIYDSGESGSRAGVVLIHGNTAFGRKLSTYQLLAELLSDRGFVVLTYDQLGFGESDDPFSLGPQGVTDAFDRLQMARVAVDRLQQNGNVDPDRVSVIGHSGGAITALKMGQSMDEIKKIILIGPPRRVRERSDEKDVAYFSRRFRETHLFTYGTPPPQWLAPEMLSNSGPWSMEAYIEPFLRPGHKPLMLIDGELESRPDKEYLERYYERLVEPKKFVRLRRSDHYCNTAQSLGFIVYDRAVAVQLVDAITSWLQ